MAQGRGLEEVQGLRHVPAHGPELGVLMGRKVCEFCGGLGTVEAPRKDWDHKAPDHKCSEYCHNTVVCLNCGGSGRVSSGKQKEKS